MLYPTNYYHGCICGVREAGGGGQQRGRGKTSFSRVHNGTGNWRCCKSE